MVKLSRQPNGLAALVFDRTKKASPWGEAVAVGD